MKQEEKWPIFQANQKMSDNFTKDSNNSLQMGAASGEGERLFEEMSGMVTLKRKGKEKGDQNQFGRITDNDNTVSINNMLQ